MTQCHSRRNLVYVLTAGSGGSCEGCFQVGIPNAKLSHSVLQQIHWLDNTARDIAAKAWALTPTVSLPEEADSEAADESRIAEE